MGYVGVELDSHSHGHVLLPCKVHVYLLSKAWLPKDYNDRMGQGVQRSFQRAVK